MIFGLTYYYIFLGNSATCNSVTITPPATKRTVPYTGNQNYFYTCSGNPVVKSKCLQCPTENQVYVERCGKCVAPEYSKMLLV